MPDIAPLADRQARYERILAMREGGATLEAIGEAEGLTRARVAAILRKPPGPAGRPKKATE